MLKAAVYNFIGLWQPELYIRTTREIANYVGKTLKYYGNVSKTAIENVLQGHSKVSPHALRNAHHAFNTFDQSRTATPHEYLDSFMNCLEVIIYSGREIGLDPDMIKLAEADWGQIYRGYR